MHLFKTIAVVMALLAAPMLSAAEPDDRMPAPKFEQRLSAVEKHQTATDAEMAAINRRLAAAERALSAPPTAAAAAASGDSESAYTRVLDGVAAGKTMQIAVGRGPGTAYVHEYFPHGWKGLRDGVYDCYPGEDGRPTMRHRDGKSIYPTAAAAGCPCGADCPCLRPGTAASPVRVAAGDNRSGAADPTTHHHTCPQCGYTWTHGHSQIHSAAEFSAAHHCPQCGAEQRVVAGFGPAPGRGVAGGRSGGSPCGPNGCPAPSAGLGAGGGCGPNGCPSGGCANGQCGATQAAGFQPFGGFFRRR